METLSFSLLVGLFLFSISKEAIATVCTQSCGVVKEIKYPFRLKSDPPECGSPNYELICKNNGTLLQSSSIEGYYFYVKGISYENKTISLVDPAFIDGNCTLPFVPRPYSFFEVVGDRPRLWFRGDLNVVFMNCTIPINHQYYYWYVPCLSQNNTFVYAFSDYVEAAESLLPSCGFLAMTKLNIDIDTDLINSSADIFWLLKEGFIFYWGDENISPWAFFHDCLKESLSEISNTTRSSTNVVSMVYLFLKNEIQFGRCLQVNYIQLKYFYFALVMLVVVWLLQFIMGRLIFTPLSILFFIAHEYWMEKISINLIEKFLQHHGASISPKRYAYTDIIALTGHFREKLGEGGFGSVFRGRFINGQHIAIKMLGNSKFNGEDFINEVSTMGRIYHVNVIRLLGFCSDGSKRALVYEYMPNGSLDKYIFSESGRPQRVFSWQKLKEIALGVARGIDYLHRGCDMQILHFDIKPHNILLDKNLNPKISDFGLAKLYPRDRSFVSLSVARGTIGYIAPELVSRSFGVISYKADVYSFGMLLLEMAGGRRNAQPGVVNSSQVYYPSWVYDKLQQNEGIEISNIYEINLVERKLCIVGLWCIQMKPSDRPPMSRVVEMLEGDIECLSFPPPPFFSDSQNNVSKPLTLRASTLRGISESSEEDD